MNWRSSIALALSVVAFVATPKIAWATPDGSESGCSGKPGIPNDICTSCGNCHTGGPAPTVAFAGPATLNSGATATYSFTVSTTQPITGVDVAATDGVTLTPGSNTQDSFGELTQPAPQSASGGSTTYSFTVTGPQYGGTIELWGCGVAANNNGANSGDGATTSTLTITIDGPANPGGGGAVGAFDAGPTPTGGFFPDGGAVAVNPPGVGGTSGGTNDNNNNDDTLHQDSGCSVRPGSLDPTALLAATAVLAALVLSRRRRERERR